MEGDSFPQDVYPVGLEDIPRIQPVLIELWNDLEKQTVETKTCNEILLELANSLCNMEGDRKRKLTAEIESENKAETLRNILELWVKQNEEQGTVANLQSLALKLRSMKCLSQGEIESFFVDYSLPAIKGKNEKAVYSLSKPDLNLNVAFSPVFHNSLILEEKPQKVYFPLLEQP